MFNCIVCRYHEIAIKGANRSMFENKLMENMRMQLSSLDAFSVDRVRGRIFVRKRGEEAFFNEKEIALIIEGLGRTFGLESFSPACECSPDIEEIFKAVERSAPAEFGKVFNSKPVASFMIRARRSDKSFPLRSKEIEIKVAELVEKLFGREKLEVDLVEADVRVGIEVRERNALVYYKTYESPGGLPVGSNGSTLALLSGGIDSPVACHMIMKRGCNVDYLTFHSHPYTPMDSVAKVGRIARILDSFQGHRRLFSCNLSPIQKLIRDKCTPKYRTVLYRRMMFRVAEALSAKYGHQAIVTGESVGQVASQTIVNLSTIAAATKMLVLRPLIGLDKRESIEYAQKIGTFPISIEQVPDSCTVFAPPSPSVAAKQDVIEKEERLGLGDWHPILDEIIKTIEIIENY